MKKKQKVLVLVGPTSSGKSALGVLLARRLNGEVISADSRQVYTGLDIGTGKITKREMRGVPHHLLDVASPKRTFSAHDYIVLGRRAIGDISKRGKVPIVVGGTGFYIDALLGRITLPDVPANKELRQKLEKKTPAQLFALLKRTDPRRADTIDPHNPRRLIRALEIATTLGKNPAPNRKEQFDTLWIGLLPPRKILEEKIALRLKARIRSGMIEEAKRLRKSGLSYKRMEALGLEYRALARFLQKKVSKKAFESELLREITRYAKRQSTYWKRNPVIRWFGAAKLSTMEKMIHAWLRA